MRDARPTKHEKLPEEVQWHLERADGFLDLKMTEAARAELELIPAELDGTVLVKQVRLRFAMEMGNWPTAAVLATELRRLQPHEPVHWVQLAYALRRAKDVQSAHEILSEGFRKFPRIAVIPFNLACYECQMQKLDEAMAHLAAAFRLDPECREQALEDDDLQPIWSRIE